MCINAREEQDVAVIDIPSAFVQMVIKDEKDKFIMRMCSEVVDILCELVPEVNLDKRGNKQLIVKCLNALYVSMVASLLYYRKFTWSLKKKNFMMNPYDLCVWNKNIGGKQLTICFHVDDCKLSHITTATG